MIRWAFFSTLAIGLFWLVYRLTLGRDRWFQLSRVYIVSTLVFGLVFPLVRIPVASLTGRCWLFYCGYVVCCFARRWFFVAFSSVSAWSRGVYGTVAVLFGACGFAPA